MHGVCTLISLAILWSMLESVSSQTTLSDVPGLFIDRLTLAGPTASHIYYTDANKSLVTTQTSSPVVYGFSWRQTLTTSAVNNGLSLHNFFADARYSRLSFKVQLSALTIYGATVNMSPLGINSSFTILTFNVILVSSSSNLIQLIDCTQVFTVLNLSPRPSNSENFQSLSSKFNFTSVTISYSMLQWVALDAINTYQNFQFQHTVRPNTNILDIKWTTISNNRLNSFKINILVINPYVFLPNIASFTNSYSTNIIPTNFGIPNLFLSLVTQNKCFMGLTRLNRDVTTTYNTRLLFDFNGDTITAINSRPNNNFKLAVYCFGQCPTYSFIDPSSSLSNPKPCSTAIPNCLTCYSSTNCTQCNSVSLLTNNNQTCTNCRNVMANCLNCINITSCIKCLLGGSVPGGCTKVIGCILVTQNTDGTSYCAKCDPYYDYNYTSKTCVCKTGRLVQLYCTDDPGCVSTYMQNGVVKCSACMIAKYFILDPVNHRCVCSDGFFLNSTQQCQQICGDGVIHYLRCDDGNLIDGDGCSSVCTIQTLYQCSVDKTKPSQCTFYGINFNLQLVDTQRMQQSNTGVFTFQFRPKMLNLAKLDLSKYFIFNASNSNYSVKQWIFSDGYAKLYVDYTSTLQAQQASVIFNFDGHYFNHIPITYNFTIASKGTKLIYQQQNSLSKPIRTCIFMISVAACVLLVVGSWLNKMIGVEYIQTIQLIYLSHFAIENYNKGLNVFQYLAFVGVNDRFFIGEQINMHLYQDYQMLTYKFTNTQATFIGITIFLSLSLFFFCFLHISSNKPTLKSKLGNQFFLIANKVISNFIFPVILSLAYPYFLLIATLKVQPQTQQETLMSAMARSVLVFISFTFYSLLLFQFFKYFFPIHGKAPQVAVQRAKSFYLISYKIFMYLTLISIWIWLRMGNFTCIFPLLSVTTLKLIVQLCSKPYDNLIDNLGIFLNVGVVIYFLSFTISINMQLIEATETKINIFVISVVALLLICFLISVIRVISAIKSRNNENWVQSENEEVRKQLNRYKDPKQFLLNKQKVSDMTNYRKALVGNNAIPIQEGNIETKDQQFLNMVSMKKKQLRSKYRVYVSHFRNKVIQ